MTQTSVCLSVRLSFCLSVRPSACPSVRSSFFLSFSLFITDTLLQWHRTWVLFWTAITSWHLAPIYSRFLVLQYTDSFDSPSEKWFMVLLEAYQEFLNARCNFIFHPFPQWNIQAAPAMFSRQIVDTWKIECFTRTHNEKKTNDKDLWCI